MVDLKGRLHDWSIRELLALSLGYQAPATLALICSRYASDENWICIGHEVDGIVRGCAGFELIEPGHAVLHHLAVAPSVRGRGIGRALLDGFIRRYNVSRIQAETHPGAAGFYRKCGFQVESLGEKYPGVERYRCELLVQR